MTPGWVAFVIRCKLIVRFVGKAHHLRLFDIPLVPMYCDNGLLEF